VETASRPLYDATTLTISIPVLKVRTSIVGVDVQNGRWDAAWLQDQVGWLQGTAYPTWSGNSLLAAHVVNADGKPGLFFHLKYLGIGEYIFIYSHGYRYTYQVLSNTVVRLNDISVFRHEEKSYLTLLTCDTFDQTTSVYLRRVMVRAKLVDVREAK
jgi:LPXTG-site transpeptidase (sortase) family protein